MPAYPLHYLKKKNRQHLTHSTPIKDNLIIIIFSSFSSTITILPYSPQPLFTFIYSLKQALLFPQQFHIQLLTMDTPGWEDLWVKHYNNRSDQRWKTKSLNPMPLEHYPIPLPKVNKTPQDPTPKQTKQPKKQKQESGPTGQEQMLPLPKMNKINDTMFCISMERDVHLFYLITNSQQKVKQKVKKIFGMISHTLSTVNQKIEQVTGSNSKYIFVKTKNNLVVLEILDSKENGTMDGLQHKFTKNIPDLITVLTSERIVIALSATHIYEFEMDNQFREVAAKKIEFPSQHQQNLYKTLMPVGIVTGAGRSLYYFGSRIEEQIDISKLKGAPGEETQRKVKSEALTIVKLTVVGDTKIEQVKGKVYPIDHIFELGIFTRSKIYEIQGQTFLVSLHEEVILIKKNFDRYIVWDNVSVVSSKSQSKKGQLILADKNILVYSENIQIFAHQIFFNEEESKLNMPAIDNFKGNDNDEQILYDALLLFYEDSIMKVLAYIKPSTVVYPTNESNFKKKETDPGKMKDEPTQLEFTIICISQSDPKKKLEQLIEKGKTSQEIEAFCQRFNIQKQDETKSRWNVSDKKLKDIQNILMEIQEDKFIQTQLDNILKKQSHNLDFLSSVEAKQLSRLNRLLVDRILAFTEAKQKSLQAQNVLEKIYDILQWYMESEMFLKKVTYSKNFLSFKEYDFIEIGKLKAASLKEEIKLLSSKKYEKRLKYFLNSFKILVISNYEEVFGFLMEKKSIPEIQLFIKQFKFILPTFEEPSPVFIRQRNYNIFVNNKTATLEAPTPGGKRERALSFAAGANDDLFKQVAERSKEKEREKEKQKLKQGEKAEKAEKAEKEEKCILWDPIQQSESKDGGKITETLQYFEEKIVGELRAKSEISKEKAVNNFKKILNNFKNKKWFENAAFKQHSMITKTTKQVHEEFKQLKRKGAFKILIKILYKKIAQMGGQAQAEINQMLEYFIKQGIIPESFKRNVDARVLVYRNLLQRKNASDGKRLIGLELPLLQDFIIKSEEKYFDFLFRNIRNKILKEVKEIYDNIQVGFFRQRFQMFLSSNLIFPDDIIEFLDAFSEETFAEEIRIDVFSAIKRLLRLQDKTNARNYINKCMDREVLPQNDDNQTGKLREQAKIPYGFFFYNFFIAFDLDYSYQEFISFTNTSIIKESKIIQELVTRYCKGQYTLSEDYSGNLVCVIHFEEGQGIHQKIPDVDIHNQPLQFFGLILHLLDVLDFQIQQKDVFELMLQNYLNENKFNQLSDFIKKLKEYHVTENNLHTNNYKMISDFKEQIDVDRQFIDYVVNWFKRNYNSISNNQNMEQKMKANQNALRMLTKSNKNAPEIKQEKSLFELLSNIRKFDRSIILNVEAIKKQALSHSSFIFLIHRFNEIGVQKFKKQAENKQMWLQSLNNFSQMFLSHKQYAYQQVADPSHPDFLRFLIQLCIIMIEENVFPIAKYLITKRIPNDQYYFKDVMLLFLTSIKIQDNKMKQFRQNVIKHILLPETTSIIRENLEEKILNYFRVNKFIELQQNKEAVMQKKDSKAQLKQQKFVLTQKSEEFIKRSIDVFEMIMSRHRKDDAYFYLIRIKRIYNDSILRIAQKYKSYAYGDQADRIRQNIQFHSYLLATSYIKALEFFIQKQFYPTFNFFESKMIILQDGRERKDMIKDVNIAMSKLDRLKVEGQTRNHHLQLIKKELVESYNKYMAAIGEDPDIKLTDGQSRGIEATRKVEIYTRKTNKDMFSQQNQEEIQYKKDLQRNLEQVNKIQEDNRINVMQREISEKITQIKKVNERHTLLEADLRKEDKEQSLATRRQRELDSIRRQQKQDIQSIKDTYKSTTTKRVNDLIENLRKNREKVAAKRNAPTSAIRDQGRQSITGINRQPNITIMQPPSIRGKQQMMVPQSPKSDMLSQHLLPITMKGKIDKIQSIREEMKASTTNQNKNILDLQKRMFSENIPEQHISSKKKVNFDEIAKIYRERQSEEAYKCIQKYDMLKNPQVRTQLIKRAYAVTTNLENFLEYLKFLMALDQSWKESIEEKSINIATQMIKMQNKEKINIKDIIPSDFFTTVVKLTIKDYYTHAFEIFRPSIKKIFEKDLMAVHAVGILFRYTLGSENRFYNKVFFEYFKVLLKNYEIKNVDDKELALLAEKIRSNYASLPDNKDQVLEELLASISNPLKKSRLLEALKRTIDRKGESMVGGQANKEISYVLQKLMK